MDEETRALQARRAIKLAQKDAPRSCLLLAPRDPSPTVISIAKQELPSQKSIPQTKKRARTLLDEVPEPAEHPQASVSSSQGSWFLSFAHEVSALPQVQVQSDDFLEVYGPKTWKDIYEFSETVSFVNGPRNQFRSQKFSSLLDTLRTYVEQWKLQKLPLMLQGETGSGKTRCLQLLGSFLGFECICLHDIFLDAMSRDELKERLAGLGSKGLNCTKKLWVVEHYDTLTEIQKNLLHGAFPSMMKCGAIVCTSWMSSAQPSAKFLYLEFLPWTTASKTKFLKQEWSPPLFKTLFWKRILRESGENISSAYSLAQLWASPTSDPTAKKYQTASDADSESFEEDVAYIPVNLRTLKEESFSDRWCPSRSLAIEAGEPELTVQLLQEMIPMAIMQGRCKNDVKELSRSMEFFSAMDSTVGYNAGAYKTVMEKRLLQNSIRKLATSSLEKFSSGSLLPIPQSFVSRSKGTSTQKLNRDAIHECRGRPADTRSWGEDMQLFLQASKKPWKSPYSIK